MNPRTLVPVVSSASLGIFAGAMFLIATAMVPYWKSLTPEAFRATFKVLGPYYGKVMVPLMIVAIASTGLAAFLSRGNRRPWIFAFVVAFAIVPLYGAVHAPVNELLLGDDPLSLESLGVLRTQWFLWHWVRTAFGGAAFLAALFASRSEPRPW